MNMNEMVENAIIGKLITTLVEEGFRLEICDQDGGGLFIYAADGGGLKPKDGYHYWVRLVPGNRSDVIVDYTTNLEAVIEPVNEFAAQFQDA